MKLQNFLKLEAIKCTVPGTDRSHPYDVKFSFDKKMEDYFLNDLKEVIENCV
jgi:hypothetical protein